MPAMPATMPELMEELTPRQIVEALDTHIIGQHDAKRAVAVAIKASVRTTRLRMAHQSRRRAVLRSFTRFGRRLSLICRKMLSDAWIGWY